jgi:hypothetical protein
VEPCDQGRWRLRRLINFSLKKNRSPSGFFVRLS